MRITMKKKIAMASIFTMMLSVTSPLLMFGDLPEVSASNEAFTTETTTVETTSVPAETNEVQPTTVVIGESTIAEIFTDPKLASAVAGEMHVETSYVPTQEELDTVTYLECDYEVFSIEGIQYLTNLEDFNVIVSPEFSDLTPLSNLMNLNSLTVVAIAGCQVTDISALGNLTNLTTLYLDGFNEVTDISALGSLTNLTDLEIHRFNEVTDISALGSLTNLTSLRLFGFNKVTDISALGSLTNLTNLVLDGFNEVTDISALGSLTNLTTLYLDGFNEVTDISALGSLTNLTSLDLDGFNEVTDISALGSLTNLTELDLDGFNEVTDISALGSLTNLTELNLYGFNEVTDISALEDLTNLTQLYMVGFDEVTDISVLGNLTNLIYLKIEGTSVSDVTPIASLTELENLYLDNNEITDLSPLSGMTFGDFSANGQNIELPAITFGESTPLEIVDQNGNQVTEFKSQSKFTYENGEVKWSSDGYNELYWYNGSGFSGTVSQEVQIPDTDPLEPSKPLTPVDDEVLIESGGEVAGIEVKGAEGTLPEGSVLEVDNISDEALDKAQEAVDNDSDLSTDYEIFAVYDFELSDAEGNVVHNLDGTVTVTAPLPEALKGMEDRIVILYIDENGNVTEMPTTVKDGKIQFTTDHFSYFAIGIKEASSNPNTGGSGTLAFIGTAVVSAAGLVTLRRKK